MQLRVAARKVESADVSRQSGIVKRAEEDDVGTGFFECSQSFCIYEIECFVPGDGNAHLGFNSFFNNMV